MINCSRKLRTRRLIVLGGLMEKEVPPDALLSKLDRSLDRDQDRALFGLPPKSPAGDDRTAPSPSAPLEGWWPARLPDGSWGSLYTGPSPEALPQELGGLTIAVRTRSGKSWSAPKDSTTRRSNPIQTRYSPNRYVAIRQVVYFLDSTPRSCA